MKQFLSWVFKTVLLMPLLLLVACGGGGGGGSSDDGDTTGTTYTLSGTLTGLTGSGLVLQNNGSDDLALSSDGSFSFATGLSDGSTYSVSVATQPTDQSCTVGNGSGTIAAADVTAITITCTDSTGGVFTIGGIVSGLTGDGLLLQNNGGDDLSITDSGTFTFTTALNDGEAYSVTVATQPTGQTCTVTNGSGSLSGAAVTDVQISCPPSDIVNPSVTVAGPKLLRFSWNDVGVDHYRLLQNPDGSSGFSQVGDNITGTSVDAVIPVHLTDWINASYMVQSCNATGDCADSITMSAASLMIDVIGYLKPSFIGSEDRFGSSVALSSDGSTLAIGVPEEDSIATGIDGDPVVGTDMALSSGAVFLFARDGDDWSQQAYFKASNAQAGDMFGQAVSLSEDGQVLAVGATAEDSAASGIDGDQTDNSLQRAGAVYIFNYAGSAWNQQAYIKASSPVAGANFGKQVSLSDNGQRLAVSGGGVYLFEDSNGWSQQAMVAATNGEGTDGFGDTLQLSGNGVTLVVGAPGEDSSATGINGDQTNNDARGAGAAYVFAYSGSAWSEQAYLKPSTTDSGDEFGNDVSISADGDSVVVATWAEDSSAIGVNGSAANNSRENSGAVYLFERQAGVWSQTAYFKASNADPNDKFGYKVALSGNGNSLAVSAAYEDSLAAGVNGSQVDNGAAASPPGAAYMFTRGDSGWFQHSYVKASNTDAGWEQPLCSLFCPDLNDEFGSSLAISGDGSTLAVGAPLENSGDSANQQDDTAPYAGAVYLY
ncbi:MAG: hypothetical protein ABW080_02655 [Candidatus Thiodiazotropha sp.]